MSLPVQHAALPRVLLSEPDLLLRRAVVQAARELELADVCDAADVHSAVALMESHTYAAMIIALDQQGDAMELLTLLRCGQYRSPASTPVAVLTGHGREGDPARLHSLEVRTRLDAPYTARSVLDTLATLLGAGLSRAQCTCSTHADEVESRNR